MNTRSNCSLQARSSKFGRVAATLAGRFNLTVRGGLSSCVVATEAAHILLRGVVASPQLRPMPERQDRRLPPLWLSASALIAAIAVVFGIQRWIDHFVSDPTAQDLHLHVVAARVGLTYGWSHIYDIDLQRQVAAGLAPSGRLIDSMHLFISTPFTAWMVAPLAWQPPAVSYLAWTLVSLASFLVAAWLVVPGQRLAKVTVLLVSLALWPVHYQFWAGQTVVATVALMAVAYWLLERERWVGCGLAMAAAFWFKPQLALLVPVALLITGRWRPVAVFAAVSSAMVVLWALTLGTSGIASWIHDLSIIESDPHNSPLTYSYLVGRNPTATIIEAALALAALGLAWYRRPSLNLVFSLGIVGTTMSASYLHEFDVAILVLGAWIILRVRPSVTQRVWLLAGIVAAQFIALGQPIPMLFWEPVWMLLLGLEPWLRRHESTTRSRHSLPQPVALQSTRP